MCLPHLHSSQGEPVSDRIIVIDFETTGLSPDQGDRTIEVGAVCLEGGVIVDRFQSLMNPGVRINSFIEHYTGITNAMLRRAPPIAEVMPRLAEFIASTPLIAHNASFDRKFLDAELVRIGRRRQQEVTCTVRVSRRVFPLAPNHKLGTLAEYLGLRTTGTAHRALADAEMTAQLWLAIHEHLHRRYGLREVPLFLLQQLQTIAVRLAEPYLIKFGQAQGS